ncbi:MAG TPA: hypothetical protein PLG91_03085 [Ferruginibacter sp.]|nr:hypothetical protein [Ferruginibacter sp.]HNF00785.1 hypothetical protein [Ferruginibacter sp.]
MKQLIFSACMAVFILSCNNSQDGSAAGSDTSKTTVKAAAGELVYPYQLDNPYKDWQPGDQKHAVTAMNALKAFENGDIAASMASFGDSINIRFDNFYQKFSKDSLTKFFTEERAKYSSVKIYMGDWESVISKDGKTEYVTMWYKQITTDKMGKTDSIAVVDDCRIMNGKIVELDEKIQRIPAKK